MPQYSENTFGVEHDNMELYFGRFFFDNTQFIFAATIIIKIVAGNNKFLKLSFIIRNLNKV